MRAVVLLDRDELDLLIESLDLSTSFVHAQGREERIAALRDRLITAADVLPPSTNPILRKEDA